MTDDGPRIERERKFLVRGRDFFEGQPSTPFLQGYLVITDKVELRIRAGPAGQTLTAKGPPGEARPEEDLPIADRLLAIALIEACDGRVLVKTRYIVEVPDEDGKEIDHWVVDEYHGDNEGLVIAEYEYPDESSSRQLKRPAWVGREVTQLNRYYGRNLVDYPYREWTVEERAD